MSLQYSEKAPVTFCDVVASFSIEEWRLLHDWQKELYKNVMNEIQKALVSLGPLVAASVFSLSTDEKEVLIPVDSAGPEACDRVNHPSGEVNFTSHLSSDLTRDQKHCLQEQDTSHWESSNNTSRVSTDEKEVLLPVDCAGSEACDGVIHPSGPLIAATVFSLSTEEKEVFLPVDSTGSEACDGVSHSSGDVKFESHLPSKLTRDQTHCLQEQQDRFQWESCSNMSRDHKDNGPIPSFTIKEETDTECAGRLNFQDRKRLMNPADLKACYVDNLGIEMDTKSTAVTTGNHHDSSLTSPNHKPQKISHWQEEYEFAKLTLESGRLTQKEEGGNTLKDDIQPSGTSQEIEHSCVLQSSEKRINTGSQPESNLNPLLDGEDTMQCGSEIREQTFSVFYHQEIPSVGISAECNAGENVSENPKVLSCQQSAYAIKTWHECTECEKGFSKRSNLLRHRRRHFGVKVFQCSDCEKSFGLEEHLILHQRTHREDGVYHCSLCKAIFSQHEHFIAHQRIHERERPYKCTKCEKRFPRKNNLTLHERMHTGEKPYQCNVCWKSFSQNSNLTSHKRMHTGEKPFQCPKCEKSFNQRGTLYRHVQTHARCDKTNEKT